MGDQLSKHFQKQHDIDPDVSARIYDTSQDLKRFDVHMATYNRLVARAWDTNDKAVEKIDAIFEAGPTTYRKGRLLQRRINSEYRKKWVIMNKGLQDAFRNAREALNEASPYLTRKELTGYSEQLMTAANQSAELPRSILPIP